MSYNLEYNILKPVAFNKVEELPHKLNKGFLFINDDYIPDDDFIAQDIGKGINYINTNNCSGFKSLYEMLKIKFQDLVVKLEVELYDYMEELKEKVENIDNYQRVKFDENYAIFVRKDVLKEKGMLVDVNELNDGEVVFCFKLRKNKRVVEMLIFKECFGEYIATIFDRNNYHQYLPEPVSAENWGVHFITNYDDFLKFKNYPSVKKSDHRLKDLDLNFDEKIVMICR